MRRLDLSCWLVLVGCALCSGCAKQHPDESPQSSASAPSSVSAPQQSAAIKAPPYRERTAEQWIAQLREGDASQRSDAAEALGYIARTVKQTYGGFSDVPYDTDELPRLDADAVQTIVAALVEALDDSESRVRASAAIGVAWIGPTAKAAVPALTRLLDDADEDVQKNVLRAIGRIGADAHAAIPQLTSHLPHGDPMHRIDVAEALRLTGAPPNLCVPMLIAFLGDDQHDHYAASELANIGDPAIPSLKIALRHENVATRKYAAYALANMAGWGKLTTDRDAVIDALIVLTHDEDPDAVLKAAQALGAIHAAPERSIPVLIGLLNHQAPDVVNTAADELVEFGAAARIALPVLITLLKQTDVFWSVPHAIREIGIDRAAADSISQMKVGDRSNTLFIPLCEYPDAALRLLENDPPALARMWPHDYAPLLQLLRDRDPKLAPLQSALFASEYLPPAVMAELHDPRFLPVIEKRLAIADAYEKWKLRACARACGAPADRVVKIAESQPGDFKPRSAWPSSDQSRVFSQTDYGHGDGHTEVIITGTLVDARGRPAVAPRFFRTNDSMLLGQHLHEQMPFTYDAKTGRFVFFDQVFAAFSRGKGTREPGPYQTGSSLIAIEAAGCKPLAVQFYDEMPDVQITLSPVQQ